MKSHDRLKKACRRLADAVGTPAFEPALTAFYEALAASSRKERETAQ